MTKSQRFHDLVSKYGIEAVLNTLPEHLSLKRRQRIEPVLQNRLTSIHIAVENPTDIHNALAIVRTSEAFGLMNVHLIGKPKKRKGKQTMQGSDRWVELAYYRELNDFLASVRSKGLLLYGAAPTGREELQNLPADKPCCLLFGNEMYGLSPAALQACDRTYRIPMHGFAESLNLSVSGAVSLYDLAQRRRKLLGRQGDLTENAKDLERAWFYARTLGLEKAARLLETAACTV